MAHTDLYDKIDELAAASGRFHPKAYLFVLQCLEHCRRRVKRAGHVSGQELVESARMLAISEYGPMAKSVLNHWGIRATDDLGTIVFQMVEDGLLSKTDEDSPDDFSDGFDFQIEFVDKYPW
jgi:uncharacterized repeat protein (TIGR04138 family)